MGKINRRVEVIVMSMNWNEKQQYPNKNRSGLLAKKEVV